MLFAKIDAEIAEFDMEIAKYGNIKFYVIEED
jgi:hypothetical protein